jgi:hypothetical protein
MPDVDLRHGARAGFKATVVMSTLFVLHPGADPPPKVVTESLLRTLGLPTVRGAWVPAHLAFGATLGVVRGRMRAPRVAFALGVWAAGYATTLPALRLYPRLTRDDRRRAFASLASHLVFGASLR